MKKLFLAFAVVLLATLTPALAQVQPGQGPLSLSKDAPWPLLPQSLTEK